MPGVGFEPTRPRGQSGLSRPRLTEFRHPGATKPTRAASRCGDFLDTAEILSKLDAMIAPGPSRAAAVAFLVLPASALAQGF